MTQGHPIETASPESFARAFAQANGDRPEDLGLGTDTQVVAQVVEAVTDSQEKSQVLESQSQSLDNEYTRVTQQTKEYLEQLGREVVQTDHEAEEAEMVAQGALTEKKQSTKAKEKASAQRAGTSNAHAAFSALHALVVGYQPGNPASEQEFYAKIESTATSLQAPEVASVVQELKSKAIKPDEFQPVLKHIVDIHEVARLETIRLEQEATQSLENTSQKSEAASGQSQIREAIKQFASNSRDEFQAAAVTLQDASSKQIEARAKFIKTRRSAESLGIDEHMADAMIRDLSDLVGVNAAAPKEHADALLGLEDKLVSGLVQTREAAHLSVLANMLKESGRGTLGGVVQELRTKSGGLALTREQVETALKAKFAGEIPGGSIEGYLKILKQKKSELVRTQTTLEEANKEFGDALDWYGQVAAEVDGNLKTITRGRELAEQAATAKKENDEAVREAQLLRIQQEALGEEMAAEKDAQLKKERREENIRFAASIEARKGLQDELAGNSGVLANTLRRAGLWKTIRAGVTALFKR